MAGIKGVLKKTLQKTLGYNNYLFAFSLYSSQRLKNNAIEEEFLHFLDIIPNDGVILDIGANIGVMTVALARVLDRATIYAFEPMPDNIAVLKRVLKYYKPKNVKLFETALGAENGTLEMVLPVVNNTKMQGLSHVRKENDNSEWNTGPVFSTTVKKLDDMDELKNLPKISAIKIDVENFEYFVFKGASELLKKHKPMIFCELWDNEVRTQCMDYLREFGYAVKVFNGKELVPFTDQEETNFFMV